MTGSVELTLAEAKSYKYVQVRLYGHAHVHWTETRTTGTGENQRTETINYTANEVYVEQTAVLWNSAQTPHGKIGPGSYRFPFQFTIPPNCPSSFHGSVGYIQYLVLGRIGTGLFKFDRRINVPIQVCQIVDINQPQLLAPIRQSQHKQVGCLCCASGNIEFTIQLPRSGFCINGDRVPLSVAVENGSGRTITMRAEIAKVVTFYARGNRRVNRSTIALVGSEAILPHSSDTWNPENFVVPLVEPSVTTSRIINVLYTLKVWAVVPYAIDPSINIPVLLGNVPYQGTFQTAVAAPSINFASLPAAEDIPWPEA